MLVTIFFSCSPFLSSDIIESPLNALPEIKKLSLLSLFKFADEMLSGYESNL